MATGREEAAKTHPGGALLQAADRIWIKNYFPLTRPRATRFFRAFMKVVSSIKSAKLRHPACQVVRRKGKIYVINKVEPRYKARQG